MLRVGQRSQSEYGRSCTRMHLTFLAQRSYAMSQKWISGTMAGLQETDCCVGNMLGVVKPAWGVQGDGGRAAGFTLCCSHCTVPGWLPLCRSLSIPRQPVHSLFSDLPGAVNILTFQVPTCHHPSQAIRIAVQGFPSGSGINGEQKGTARGNGPQGRHTGEEGARGTAPLSTLTRWGD